MTEVQREDFAAAMNQLAAAALARGEAPGGELAPHFHLALKQHPEEEGRLLELWDKLTTRQVM